MRFAWRLTLNFEGFFSSDIKECLDVVLLKGTALRQWLIYFLSHTAASNHRSLEPLAHPSIMLSRHIIFVSVCVRAHVYELILWGFKSRYKRLLRWHLDIRKSAHLCFSGCINRVSLCQSVVYATHPNVTRSPCSLWLNRTLSSSRGHALMCEHRSVYPTPKGRWSFLLGQSHRNVSLGWLIPGLTHSMSLYSLFTWAVAVCESEMCNSW